jgi:hypothetical protein
MSQLLATLQRQVRTAAPKAVAADLLLILGSGMAGAEGTPCNAEPADTTIAYGALSTCAIAAVGDTDVHRFTATAGERVVVQVTWRDGGGPFSGAPCAELRGPDGSLIEEGCGGFAARLEATLGQAGGHSIVVSESNDDETMAYAVALERVSPPSSSATPLCFGCNLTGLSVDGVGDLDLFTFPGATGRRIVAQATYQEGGGPFAASPCAELRRPDGTLLEQACGSFSALIEATVDQPGTYSFLVHESNNDDTMAYSVSLQCLSACSTTPQPTCNGRSVTILGTAGDDLLVGSPGADVMAGRGGNDIVNGGAGDDVICGEAGNDLLIGGPGRDTLLAGAGNDVLMGDAGADTLLGGTGNDALTGGPDDDVLRGQAGADVCDGTTQLLRDIADATCELRTNIP